MRSVTPLPATLSGKIIQRLIEIDEALIPYVNGALVWLCDREPFEETGSLTVDEAKLLFSDMLQIYFTESPAMFPIGTIAMFATEDQPEKWLNCVGTEISRAEYAALFAVIGTMYGAGDGTTTFNVPDFRDLSLMGYGGSVVGSVGAVQGALEVTLDTTQVPSHNHTLNDTGHTHQGANGGSFHMVGGTGTKNAQPFAGSTMRAEVNTSVGVTGITINNTGGGLPHSNLHPVIGANFIIYAGV